MAEVDAVQLLPDRQAIHDVVVRYAFGVDRRDMEMVRSCFTPDLEVVGWGRGEVADRESMIRCIITRRGGDPIWAPTGVTRARTDDPAVRWLLDRAEIHDLLMQYALGVDLRDYERVGRCFATDFRAAYGDREFREVDALVEFVRGVGRFSSTTHFVGTHLVEVAVGTDEAWQHAYSLVSHRPTDGADEWVLAGRYTDRLVREEGRWRIAERGPFVADGRFDGGGRCAPPRSDAPRVQALIDRAAVNDAIVRSALALDRADGRTRRLLNNDQVTIHGDRAHAETYLFATTCDRLGRPSPWSRGARRWVDDLRRGRAGWEVAARREVDNRVPDELVISPGEAAARASRHERA